MDIHWSRERLYQRLETVDPIEYDQLIERVVNAKWRQKFHVQPLAGLLNDPNGFSWFNGEYHLFYQWFPLGAAHGLKYWYHTTSKNLVEFENRGIALSPDTIYDSHGVYSGSATVVGEDLILFYTGNTRDEDWARTSYQCIAQMNEKDEIVKWETPVISSVPEGFTQELRDPKIWRKGEVFYCVIGAQCQDGTGAAVFYRSDDLKSWTFLGDLHTNYTDFGYMWECPDVFTIDGTDFLLFSPLCSKQEGDSSNNLCDSGFLSGKIDLESMTMVHESFQKLDHGFDFYAAQTMEGPTGERILIAWMAIPQLDYPTYPDGWAHCMTLPRVLTVEEGRLKQRLPESWNRPETDANHCTIHVHPSSDLLQYRGECYELQITIESFEAEELLIDLRVHEDEFTRIVYQKQEQTVIFDREFSGEQVQTSDGHKRILQLERPLTELRIVVDISSVEVFLNDGDAVMSSRIFPGEDSTGIRLQTQEGTARVSVSHWDLSHIAFEEKRIIQKK